MAHQGKVRLFVVAPVLLHGAGTQSERGVRELDAAAIAQMFAVPTIEPALVLKRMLLFSVRDDRSGLAADSGPVGSISDNELGGRYSYRVAKAALKQLLNKEAIKLRRRHRHSICMPLHPGTVSKPWSAPFSQAGLEVQESIHAAAGLLCIIAGLATGDSGVFFNHHGKAVPG